jgi:dihydrodipicolinate synthase/N-acetylneuraminate lyase
MTSPETQAMLKWLQQNRRMLRQSYPNQYVAYNAEGMIAHDENLEVVQAIAKASQQPYTIYVVPPRSNASIQIHSLYH